MPGKRRVYGAPFKAKVALAAAKGDRTTAQLASQFGIHTSQVTAWKKQLMAQVAELFADGRQRRPDQATDEQELFEQCERRSKSAAQFGDPEHCEPLLPPIEGLLADPELADDLGHRSARLSLP